MQEVDSTRWVKNLQVGDMGALLGINFFSTVQNWERIVVSDCPSQYRASHSFIVKNPPFISEANGLFISEATILKNIGDKTKVWIYRYGGATDLDKKAILDYCAEHEKKNLWHAIKDGDYYGVPAIAQFGMNTVAHLFGQHVHITDTPGEYCTEYSGKGILQAKWPYSKDPSFTITPSDQRYWFELIGVAYRWTLAQWYDGAGKFWIA